jgi:hypothetical protein
MPTSGKNQAKKPPPPPDEPAKEFFYPGKAGRRFDANLHNPILDDGNTKTAYRVSREVALKLGLRPEQIDSLMSHVKKG